MTGQLSPYLGREYFTSLELARQAGEAPDRVHVTRPFHPCLGEGALRIVGERQLDGQRQWILAYERYRRPPRRESDDRSRAARQP